MPRDWAEALVVPAQPSAHDHTLKMVGCGDKRWPLEECATLIDEYYYRWFGGLDGLNNVVATAEQLSGSTFKAVDGIHEHDEEVLHAHQEAGLCPINHVGCLALEGRVAVAESIATPKNDIFAYANIVLGGFVEGLTLSWDDYERVCEAKEKLLTEGKVHEPETVLKHYTRDDQPDHLPTHDLAKLCTTGKQATALVLNRQPDTMRRPPESEIGASNLTAYWIDQHIVTQVYEALANHGYRMTFKDFCLAYAVHTGAILADHLPKYRRATLPIRVLKNAAGPIDPKDYAN